MNPFKIFKKMENIDEVVNKGLDTAGNIVKMGSSKEQTTERLRIDSISDNWLAKSIRPITLIWFMLALTLIIILDAKGIDIKLEIIEIVKYGILAAVGFYFVGRDVLKNRRIIKDTGKEVSLKDQLKDLNDLLKSNLITEEEFNQRKEKILKNYN